MLKKLFDKLLGGNTLYYPGCLTKVALPGIEGNYRTLLDRMGIDFITLANDEACCGSPAYNAGYLQDFEDLKERNLALFRRFGVKRIITACPTCAHVFNDHYGKSGIPAEHITATVLAHIGKFSKLPKRKTLTYHDPCHLGRYADGYDAPRRIFGSLGYGLVEMRNAREDSMCCGGGASLRTFNTALAQQIAKLRTGQAADTGAGILVNTCPMCHSQLKEAVEKHYEGKIEALELSELLLRHLR
ncbi:(Fe-S)-binding protein [Candidatus Woesearchaeota archaeon]|nr:(Fe-S)-binding protein [Candidatus Woesearchaeota archaeon]